MLKIMLMVKKIVLSVMMVLAAGCLALVAQNRQISGTVTGADGAPIAGATVVVDGTTIGTTTDAAGRFSLSAPIDAQLSVSFIGYKEQTVPVAGKTTVDVVLVDDHKVIDDVIVVAFGEAKKEAFTGSATVVGADELAHSQVSNAMNALNGKVAGVQMSNSSGSPADDSPTIRVRGFSSINAGNAPLVVLDGIPYDGSMNNINPSDIETMTVLKDAASNALYGSRGANGVIMITTKRAKSQDAVVNVDAKWGVNSRAVPDYDYIKNPAAYYEQHYKALNNYYINTGKTAAEAHLLANSAITGPAATGGLAYQVFNVPEGQFFIGKNGKVNPNATLGNMVSYGGQDYYLYPDNWVDETMRDALRQEYNVSVSGGTGRAQFYASFGYLNNQGIVQKTDFERYTARLKAEYQAKKWLRVGANASYTHYNGNLSSEDGTSNSTANIFAATSQVAPIYPLYVRGGDKKIMTDANGYTVYDYGTATGAGSNAGIERPIYGQSNALGDHLFNKSNFDGNAFTGTAFFDVTFLKDFKFTMNIGTSLDEQRSTELTNAFYGQYAPSNGILYKGHSRSWSYNFQQLLNWQHTFAEVHSLGIMIGHENYRSRGYVLTGSKSNMFSPDNLELAGAVTDRSANSYTTDYNTEGYFGRVQYDWKEKVFVSGSYRRDASSKFHPKHRWGNFWSVGAAWIISREDWFNAGWIDMLKIKASYGSQGNDGISSYLYTDTYDIVNSGGNVSLVPNMKGNEYITWETNGNFNAGVEFELFKGKLGGSIEGFYRKTTDMLSWFTVPPSLGYSGYYANIGDMVNKGVEVELFATPVRTKDVTWSLNANLTYVNNKITKLAPSRRTQETPEGYKGYSSSNRFYGEGLSLYSYYMAKYAGVDKSTGLPMWYMDVEGPDGKVRKVTTTEYNSATQYICGDPLPDAYGGFGTTLEFFGFDFTVNFTYQIGGLIYDSGYATLMGSPTSSSIGFNYHRDLENAWTPTNRDSNIPRFQYNDNNIVASSDRFLIDGSYLNLQNINFGYTLPKRWTSKISVDKIRIYLACENVWVWSRRQGFDPRLSLTGSNNATTYSAVRTISGGINLTF